MFRNPFKRKKKIEPVVEEPKVDIVKTKKEKTGMNVEKQLAAFKEKHAKAIKDCQGDVEVITLERKHFKDTLSQSNGFGFQDLKKKPRKFVTSLMAEGYDLAFTPVGKPTASNFSLKITASKKKF